MRRMVGEASVQQRHSSRKILRRLVGRKIAFIIVKVPRLSARHWCKLRLDRRPIYPRHLPQMFIPEKPQVFLKFWIWARHNSLQRKSRNRLDKVRKAVQSHHSPGPHSLEEIRSQNGDPLHLHSLTHHEIRCRMASFHK